jgi:biopolymer transport protein ExbB
MSPVLVELFQQFMGETAGFYWVLAAMFLASLVIFVMKLIRVNIQANMDGGKFANDIFAMIKKGDIKSAHRLADSLKEKALAYIFSRALEVAAEREIVDYRNIQNAVDEAALEIVPQLTKKTAWLQTFAGSATLIGLMGTIWGLVISFKAVSASSAGGSEALTQGISTAMLTTLMGLIVAIPANFFYAIINNATNKILEDIDEYSVKLIHLMTRSH